VRSSWTPDELFKNGETGMWQDGRSITVYFPYKLKAIAEGPSRRLVFINSRIVTEEEFKKMRDWVGQY
jgi:hypothetical protein